MSKIIIEKPVVLMETTDPTQQAYRFVKEVEEKESYESMGYVSIAKPYTIKFELIPQERILASKLKTLEQAAEEIKTKALKALAEVTEKKQKLLALPYLATTSDTSDTEEHYSPSVPF